MNQLQKHLVVKSNQLINAQYKLKAIEKKIICIILALIDSCNTGSSIYEIELSKLIFLLDIKNNNAKKEVIKTLTELHKKTLVLNHNEKVLITSWFSSVLIDENNVVYFEVSTQLKPFLLALKKCFTVYHISNILRFKSYYSMRLYELCKQFETIGKSHYKLGELKSVMGISTQYKQYKNFKRKVLMPAINEINNHSDLMISVKENLTGRSVSGLSFKISGQRNAIEQK